MLAAAKFANMDSSDGSSKMYNKTGRINSILSALDYNAEIRWFRISCLDFFFSETLKAVFDSVVYNKRTIFWRSLIAYLSRTLCGMSVVFIWIRSHMGLSPFTDPTLMRRAHISDETLRQIEKDELYRPTLKKKQSSLYISEI